MCDRNIYYCHTIAGNDVEGSAFSKRRDDALAASGWNLAVSVITAVGLVFPAAACR